MGIMNRPTVMYRRCEDGLSSSLSQLPEKLEDVFPYLPVHIELPAGDFTPGFLHHFPTLPEDIKLQFPDGIL